MKYFHCATRYDLTQVNILNICNVFYIMMVTAKPPNPITIYTQLSTSIVIPCECISIDCYPARLVSMNNLPLHQRANGIWRKEVSMQGMLPPGKLKNCLTQHFQCIHLGKKYPQKSNLKTHQNKYHQSSTLKSYNDCK